MSKITVYRFTKYDITSDVDRLSRRWATLEAIERVCGSVVEGTAFEIDSSDIGTEIPGMTARNFDPHPRPGFQQHVRS